MEFIHWHPDSLMTPEAEAPSIAMSATLPNYPGLGLRLKHAAYEKYCSNTDSALLPLREVAMMAIVSQLTDKPDWHRKVFDEEIVAKWKKEAMAVPDNVWVQAAAAPNSKWEAVLSAKEEEQDEEDDDERLPPIRGVISDQVWEYCVQELQSKARYYERSSMIPVLDACASVVKSDKLVDSSLHDALEEAFKKLQDNQAGSPDWHPNTNDMVQDLVHPSLYPLVYGRSKVLREEIVGVEDAIKSWSGKGSVIPSNEATGNPSWSATYQWLPSNVAFQEDGSVKFTSYINNLHPNKYPGIYSTIEKLIETALPAWNQCLFGKQGSRITGPGRKESRFAIPDEADDYDDRNWIPSETEFKEAGVDLTQEEGEELEEWEVDDEIERLWKLVRKPILREPDTYQEVNYEPSPAQHSLFEKFKNTGLQIIVKMVSIELTPEKPEFPAGGWHIEGQRNERICTTVLYYLDSENITDSSLSFRMETSWEQEQLQDLVGQNAFRWLECNYVTDLRRDGCCVQNYGTVDTRPGRLLAFPNVLQHRVSSFKLADPTKPGHRRFIALWLVDPHIRIISTANVPPQQQEWWAEAAFGESAESQKSAGDKLPADLVTLLQEKGMGLEGGSGREGGARRLPQQPLGFVRDELKDLGIMSLDEARDHRLELMKERSTKTEHDQELLNRESYNFCEH